MHTYGWSEDYVLYELACARGHAYCAWALENALWGWGSLERTSDGYIAQECARRRRVADS